MKRTLRLAVLAVLASGCRTPALPESREELATLVGSNDLAVQGPAARKLEELYGEAAVVAVLVGGNETARGRAAMALRDNPTANARASLANALNDESPNVRLKVLWSLKEVGLLEHLPAVASCLDDVDTLVRQAASDAAAAIKARGR